MASYLAYWEGKELATISAEQIDPPELKRKADAMNLAFRLYYNGMNFAKACEIKLRDILIADLRDAATDGWGAGVSDLEEAFVHLEKNNGRWTDTNSNFYTGGPTGVGAVAGYGNFTTASAIRNFLSAIDSRAAKIRELLQEHAAAGDKVAEASSNPNWNKVGTPQWEKVGDGLSKIKTVTENIQRFLWLAPKADEPIGEIANKGLEIGGKFLSAASDTRAAVEMFTKAKQAGYSDGAAALLTALQKGMGSIPVLGELYGEAIGLIPGITAGIGAIAERQRNQIRIALYGPGAGEQMDWAAR